jgi:hypothetical protein
MTSRYPYLIAAVSGLPFGFREQVGGQSDSAAIGANVMVANTFLSLVAAGGSTGAFWIHAGLGVISFLFMWRVLPETRGRSLQEIERSW